MDTQRGLRLLRGAFAVAIVMGSMTPIDAAQADDPQRTNTPVVYPYQGPGVGSVKSPPFYDAAYQAYINQRHDARRRVPMPDDQTPRHSPQHQGPGPWSVKAPGIH